MPLLSLDSPTIVHHMAALDPMPAPPNSLAAVQASLEAGAAFVEVDVTALAARDYLLVHDPELEAETSGQGAVSECMPEEASSLYLKENGVKTAHHAALLSEVVRLVNSGDRQTRLQLDFKNIYPLRSEEPLHRLIGLVEPLGERVIVSSGADWQLRKLRKLAPWLTLGFDCMFYIDWQPEGEPRDPREIPKQRGAYGYYDDHPLGGQRLWSNAEYLRDRCESLMGLVPDVSVFYLRHALLAESLKDGFNWAEACHARGILVDAWTMDVTDPVAVENAPRLLSAGVDLFTTNTPRGLATLLGLDHARPSK